MDILPKDIILLLFNTYFNFKSKIAFRATCRRFRLLQIGYIPLKFNYKLTDNILKQYPHLKELSVYPPISDEGLRWIPNLQKLRLIGRYVYGRKLDTLITDSGLKLVTNLTALDIYCESSISDEGLQCLPYLTTLSIPCGVTMGSPHISNIGLRTLTNLTHLYMSCNTFITNEALQYLPNLLALDVGGSCNITDDGLKFVPRLEWLNASNNPKITDVGLQWVPNLKTLGAAGESSITDNGLQFVTKLTKLGADENLNISAKAYKRINGYD